eukprot:GHVT01042647.1.p1 GENE.GHVT01042647.1~~GHVT01042647.1.p1  ORF type:complete len:384 (+),score=84.68 GHVT01042647.1:116-1267(+)
MFFLFFYFLFLLFLFFFFFLFVFLFFLFGLLFLISLFLLIIFFSISFILRCFLLFSECYNFLAFKFASRNYFLFSSWLSLFYSSSLSFCSSSSSPYSLAAISFCFPSFADSSNRRRVFDQLASVFEAEEKKNGRQESMARGVLADEFSKRGDFVSAAKIFELGKSNSIEEWLPSHQIEWLVKMAGLQLLGGLVQSAEVSVARGNSLRRRLTADARKENEKILRSLQLLHAQVADHRGKFEAAFFRYAELSRAERADSDSDNFFTSAVACAILAAPGPEKEQIGATLMKDRRFFSSRHLTLATQIFQRKFIGPEQLQTFAATLLPHHLAVQPSGYRLLDECIQLHNVCAAPLFFRNAALPHMAQLLQCSEGQVAAIFDYSKFSE